MRVAGYIVGIINGVTRLAFCIVAWLDVWVSRQTVHDAAVGAGAQEMPDEFASWNITAEPAGPGLVPDYTPAVLEMPATVPDAHFS